MQRNFPQLEVSKFDNDRVVTLQIPRLCYINIGKCEFVHKHTDMCVLYSTKYFKYHLQK